GDVAAGPMPVETIERLAGLGPRARFVRGNADRYMVEVFDSGPQERYSPLANWPALQLQPAHRDLLAGFEPSVELDLDGLGRVLFCHATPASDEPIITVATPEPVVAAALAETEVPLVVAGHTHMQFDRRVGDGRMVTASWTDPTMTASGVFYPEDAKSAEDRLRYYASQFPVVEVDATYYALPREHQSKLWAERTPEDFVMDVKAHALMTGQPTEVKRLPKDIRDALPEKLKEKARIYGKDLPAELHDEVWNAFKQGVEPLRAAGRLGAIFLQFPRWVFPSSEARERILDAKSRLGDMQLTVEFRHGSWFNEKNAERTMRFLT